MHIQSRRHFLKNAAILSPVHTFFPSYVTANSYAMTREFISVVQRRNMLSGYAATANSVITPIAASSAKRGSATIQFSKLSNPII